MKLRRKSVFDFKLPTHSINRQNPAFLRFWGLLVYPSVGILTSKIRPVFTSFILKEKLLTRISQNQNFCKLGHIRDLRYQGFFRRICTLPRIPLRRITRIVRLQLRKIIDGLIIESFDESFAKAWKNFRMC